MTLSQALLLRLHSVCLSTPPTSGRPSCAASPLQARGTRLARAVPCYSNFGFELLSHALAVAAGTTSAELFRHRVAELLDISTLYALARAAELPPTTLACRSRSGRPGDPGTGEAIAPAGGLRASITDMVRLTGVFLEGTAPGVTALDELGTVALVYATRA